MYCKERKNLLVLILLILNILLLPLIFSGCENLPLDILDQYLGENSDTKVEEGNAHFVKFDSDGGTYIGAQKIYRGERVTAPDNPTKNGYIFDGWYLENTEWSFADNTVTEDITLVAKWLKAYTVNFKDLNSDSIESVIAAEGGKIEAPAAPEKEGYAFLGWYLDGKEWMFESDTVSKDVTLTAKWKKVHVIYYLSDNSVYATEAVIDGEISSLKPTPAKEGYIFNGWYNGDEKWTGDKNIDADITLKAKWTKICTVTFMVDDEITSTQTLEEGSYITMPESPEKDGSVFVGWYFEDYKFDFDHTRIADDITIFAKWQKAYIVTFIVDDEVYATKTVAENEPLEAPTAPQKDDLSFRGWCTEDGERWDFTTNTVTGNLTLTAEWSSLNVGPYPWDTTSLWFQMNSNSHRGTLTSGCKKYLAGEDANVTDTIDVKIMQRNVAAETYAKVDVDYQYWPEGDANYGWGKSYDQIMAFVNSNSTEQPDMYCTFLYDMMCASLQRCFANLKSTTRGTNYFQFNSADYDIYTTGYMYDFMKSLTLNPAKMYLLASDYFIDTVRAFFIVPANVHMLNSIPVAKDENNAIITEGVFNADRTGDGKFDVNDFFELIWDREWTYEAIQGFSAAIYSDDDDVEGASTGDILGFAIDNSGFSSAALLYTSSVSIIERWYDYDYDEYDYQYPEYNPDLFELVDNINDLFSSEGVFASDVSGDRTTSFRRYYDDWHVDSELKGIRESFAGNKILFGGFIMTGNLDETDYQEMKYYGRLAIAPPPLYKTIGAEDMYMRDYLTHVHNIARVGAISAKTQKFSQCTAFLDYQSTHSTEILNEYYNDKITLAVAGEQNGNARVMQLIRASVRSGFDKAFEDAISFFFKSTFDAEARTWTSILSSNQFQMTGDDFSTYYYNYVDAAGKNTEGSTGKARCLILLEQAYAYLPD